MQCSFDVCLISSKLDTYINILFWTHLKDTMLFQMFSVQSMLQNLYCIGITLDYVYLEEYEYLLPGIFGQIII